MEDASDDLDESRPRDATVDQDAALAELEDAMAELEEALKQLRAEEQEEILRDLEGRFREMLAKQLEVNKGTTELYAIGRHNFKRAEVLRTAELSSVQDELGNDAARCMHVLEEEGTTVVFPAILGQLSEDMRSVAARLAELNVGVLTQTMEEEIVMTLQDLVEAIERKLDEMQNQGQSGKPGQPGDQPLLPTSAELKLLQSMEVRVLKRTSVIETERVAGTINQDELHAVTKSVTKRQGEAAEIALEMRDLEEGS